MNFDWLFSAFSAIGNALQIIWVWIVGILPTIDAICMSFIAYYTFRLTIFPKKIKFINVKQSFSVFLRKENDAEKADGKGKKGKQYTTSAMGSEFHVRTAYLSFLQRKSKNHNKIQRFRLKFQQKSAIINT